MESGPWMEQILLQALDISEITMREAFELCFPEKNIDQISTMDIRRMSACLKKNGWSKAGRYTGGPKRNQTKFVRMITSIFNAHMRMSFIGNIEKVYKLLLLSSYFKYNITAACCYAHINEETNYIEY